MGRVSQLGYVGVQVRDLHAWENFATAVLGLEPNPSEDGTLRLRMDEYRQRVIIAPGEQDDLAFLGWEVRDAAALEEIAATLEAAGNGVTRGTAAQTAARRVAGLVHLMDPNGIRTEIYHGPEVAFDEPFHSPRPLAGFVTGEQGLGHAVVATGDLAASLRFYRDLLGMRESDYARFERGGRQVHLAFLHCNPRHHTLALVEGERPRRLQHIMLQLRELDDVGRALALCRRHEVPIAATLGRHTNDHMVSFYMTSPSGFEIEYGWGARTIDDTTWKVQRHRSPSIWGHRRELRA